MKCFSLWLQCPLMWSHERAAASMEASTATHLPTRRLQSGHSFKHIQHGGLGASLGCQALFDRRFAGYHRLAQSARQSKPGLGKGPLSADDNRTSTSDLLGSTIWHTSPDRSCQIMRPFGLQKF